MGFRPVLRSPGGSGHQQYSPEISLPRAVTTARQTRVGPRGPREVAEDTTEECTRALHRVQIARDAERAIVGPRRRPLTHRSRIETCTRAVREARQRCTLDKALRIDHPLVLLRSQLATQRRQLADEPPRCATPAAQRRLDHAFHGRMPGRNRRECRLDDPIEADVEARARFRYGRQGVQHVAEGRCLDQEDSAHGQALSRRSSRATSTLAGRRSTRQP